MLHILTDEQHTKGTFGMAHSNDLNEFNRSLLRAINDSSPDGILVVNRQDIIISINQRFFTVWDIPCIAQQPEDFYNKPDAPILQLATERVLDQDAFLTRVRQLYDNPELTDVCDVVLKDGRTLERHSTALLGNHGHYLGRVWYFRDVTEKKKLENELRLLAETDPLTGVANRRQFYRRANEETERSKRMSRPLSVIMLDIDCFKDINDRWGHEAGDLILQETTIAWREALRVQDILARVGGEEFVVLLPDTDLIAAQAAAKRLKQSLAHRKASSEQPDIVCTASAGIAELHDEDANFDACLCRADAALYRAKRAGRNRINVDVGKSKGRN